MKLNKFFNFCENSINFTNKFLSKPKKFSLLYQSNQNKITIILLFLCFLTISLVTMHRAINQDNLILTIYYSTISVISLYFLVPTMGNIFVEFNPNHPFHLKKYAFKLVNNNLIEEPFKQRKKIVMDVSIGEIDYAYRPPIKPGPGNIGIKYFAIKYYLIQHFYKSERIDTIKYKSAKDFYKKIGSLERIDSGSFKTQFSKIKHDKNIEGISFENKKILILLIKNNELKDYPLAYSFAKNYIS